MLFKKAKDKVKSQNGITMTVLVITIIVMLILAGIAIAIGLGGKNGIVGRANEMKFKSELTELKRAVDEKIVSGEFSGLSSVGSDTIIQEALDEIELNATIESKLKDILTIQDEELVYDASKNDDGSKKFSDEEIKWIESVGIEAKATSEKNYKLFFAIENQNEDVNNNDESFIKKAKVSISANPDLSDGDKIQYFLSSEKIDATKLLPNEWLEYKGTLTVDYASYIYAKVVNKDDKTLTVGLGGQTGSYVEYQAKNEDNDEGGSDQHGIEQDDTTKIDTKGPEIDISGGDDGWKQSHEITIKIDDSDSGTDGKYEYQWVEHGKDPSEDEDDWTEGDSDKVTTLDGKTGNYDLYIKTKDQLGNESETHKDGILIDNTAPILTEITFKTDDGKKYTPGTWTSQNITITLTGKDGHSGIGKFQYKENGGDWKEKEAINGVGTITLKYEDLIENISFKAVDNAGNESAESKEYEIKMDKLKPNKDKSVSYRKETGEVYDHSTWTNEKVTATISISDQGYYPSKVRKYQYYLYEYGNNEWVDIETTGDEDNRIGTVVFDFDYDGTIKYKAIDNAGNEFEFEDEIHLDYQDPYIQSITFKTGTSEDTAVAYTPGTWANKNIYATVKARDYDEDSDPSGVKTLQYSSDNGSTWKSADISSGTATIEFNKEINLNYIFRVIDNAGNTSDNSSSYNLKIDRTVPNDMSSTPESTTYIIPNTSTTSNPDNHVNVNITFKVAKPDDPKSVIVKESTGEKGQGSLVNYSSCFYKITNSAADVTYNSSDNSWTSYSSGSTIKDVGSRMDREGAYYFHIRFCDNAGNEKYQTFGPFNVVKPEDAVSVTHTPNPNWTREVSVTARFADYITKNKKFGYGITEKAAKSNSSSINNSVYEFSQNETTNGYVYLKLGDAAGNTAELTNYRVTNIDKLAPDDITLSTKDITKYKKIKIEATVNDAAETPSDGSSGAYSYFFTTDTTRPTEDSDKWIDAGEKKGKGRVINGQDNDPAKFESEEITEENTWYFWVKDGAGNINGKSIVIDEPIIDWIPPRDLNIEAHFDDKDGELYDNKWTNHNVYLELTAWDVNGINRFEWFDTPSGKWVTTDLTTTKSETDSRYGTGVITFNVTRDENVKFRVYDEANNYTEGTYLIKIDKTNPVISEVNNSSNGNWVNTAITLSWTITEVHSGVGKVQYSSNGSTWNDLNETEWYGLTRDNERNDKMYFRVIDAVGNISNVVNTDMKIDKTVPNDFTNVGSIETYIKPTSGNTKINLKYKKSDPEDPKNSNNTASGINGTELFIKITNSNEEVEYQSDDTSWIRFTSNSAIKDVGTAMNGVGQYYAHLRIIDNAGNEKYQTFGPYTVVSSQDAVSISHTPNPEWTQSATVKVNFESYVTKNKKFGYAATAKLAKSASINLANSVYEHSQVVTSNGYVYVKIGDAAGNTVELNTYKVENVDSVKPTISVSPTEGTVAKTRNVTITASDDLSGMSDSNSYQYQLGESNTTAPNGTWNNYTSGTPVTLGGNLTGTYYLWVREIKDKAGNISDENGTKVGTYHVFGSYVFDNLAPVISFDPNGNASWAKSQGSKVTVVDQGTSGNKTLKYKWTQSQTAPTADVFEDEFESEDTITKSDGTGNNWYLWIYAEDNSGNSTIQRSNAFYLDNTNPVVEASNIVYGNTLNITLKDSHSGVNGWQIVSGTADTAPTSNWTNITATTNTTVSKAGLTYGTYRIWAKDVAGNTSYKQIDVTKNPVTIPTKKTDLTYNASEQTQDFNYFDTSLMTISGDQKATNAGNYIAKFTLKDKTNYCWSNNTTDDISVPWTIAKYNISGNNSTIAATTDQIYTGNEITPKPAVTVPIPSGRTTTLVENTHFTYEYSDNKEVGIATITVKAKDNTNYTGSKTSTFNIVKQEVTVPTIKNQLTFDTTEQTQKWNNYNTALMNLGGQTKGTNAGTYTAIFSLKDKNNYRWAGGTSDDKSIDWTINKYDLSQATIEPVSEQTYTGREIKPTPVVQVSIPTGNTTELSSETDFVFGYANNINVGIATITVTARENSNYKGNTSTTFEIVQNGMVIPTIKNQLTYNTLEQTQEFNDYDTSKMTISGVQKATNAGSYIATFTLKDPVNNKWNNNETGPQNVEWTIDKYDLSQANMSQSAMEYTGDRLMPKPAVTVPIPSGRTTPLTENVEFVYNYGVNINAGTNAGYVEIKAKDNTNYKGSKKVFFDITVKTLKVPESNSTLTYNTLSQSPDWKYYDSTYMNISGDASAINSGNYTAIFSLRSTSNLKWEDGSVTAKEVNWSIEKYDLSQANMTQSALEYTGSQLTPKPAVTVNIPSSSNKTPLTEGTHFTYSYGENKNAGTKAGWVKITAVANTNYTGNKTVEFDITSKKLAIPSQSGTLTYNTQSQSPSWSNYDSSKMTVGGTTSGIDADTYNATFTLKDTTNYKWSDGTTGVKNVPWTIGKADGYITLDDNKSVEYGTASTTFAVRTNHGGTLTVADNNATAGCSINGTTVTINNISTLSAGTQVTVTVMCGETKNYKSASKNFVLTIGQGVVAIPSPSEELTYNTRSQSPTWLNYDSSKMTIGGTTSGTDAGTYNATFTLKNTTNYKWSDGSTTAKTVPWKINQANGYVTLDDNKSVAYGTTSTIFAVKTNHGGTLTVADNNATAGCSINGTAVTINNISTLVTGSQVTVTVTCGATKNYKSASANFVLTIGKESLPIPSQSGSLTFNTISQSPTWSNYDSSKMTIGGDTSGINAGSYTATFTLKDTTNYQWSNGQVTAQSKNWVINKYDISGDNSTMEAVADQTYTGTSITPTPSVTVPLPSGRTTTLNTENDITYSYTNNTNPGDNATVTATAKSTSNYTGSKSVTFKILKKDNPISVSAKSLTYNAANQDLVTTSNAQGTVYYKIGTELTSSNYTNGETSIPQGKDAGTYVVYYYVTGNTYYKDKKGSVSVTIGKYSLSNSTIAAISNQNYTGDNITPKPAVTVPIPSGSTSTLGDSDITYSYSNNKEPGDTAKVTVTAKDNSNYKDSNYKTFIINPRVTFDKNSSEATGTMNPQYVTYNTNTALSANAFSRTGYEFIGWSTTSTSTTATYTNKANVKLTANTTLYAVWRATTGGYTVIHQQQNVSGSGYTTVETESLSGTIGQSVTPAVKSYTGFTSPSTQTATITAGGTLTITYQYTRNKYNYTLGTNANATTTGSTASGSYYYGATITLKGVAKTGYTWSKWASSNTSLVGHKTDANTTFTMPAGALTMTPTVTGVSYTVEYYQGNGASGATKLTSSTHTYGTAKALTAYSGTAPNGWSFAGWGAINNTSTTTIQYTNSQSVSNLTSTANGTVKLYAIFKRTITLTYDGNGATGGSTADQTEIQYYNPWTTSNVTEVIFELRENGFTKTGYTFSQWETTPIDTGTSYEPGEDYDATKASTATNTTEVLYAIWNAATYTLTLDSSDATTHGTTSIVEKYGDGYYLNDELISTINPISIPKRLGNYTVTFNYQMSGVSNVVETAAYQFDGYYYNDTAVLGSSGTLTPLVDSTTFTSNVTLHANWTGNQFVYVPVPQRKGYIFEGWYVGSLSGTKVDGGTKYYPTGNVTLYAKWEPEIWSITLDTQGASEEGTTEIYQVYGSYVTALWNNIEDPTGSMGANRNPIDCPEKDSTIVYNYNYLGSTNVSDTIDFNFKGYYLNKEGTGNAIISSSGYLQNDYADGTYFDISSILYAKWEMEETYSFRTATRNGFEFLGWYTDPTNGTKITDISQLELDGYETLYAHWRGYEYSVEYYDGSTLLKTETGTYNGSIKLTSIINIDSKIVPSGFSFYGWMDGELSGTMKYTDGANIEPEIYAPTRDEDVLKIYAISRKAISFVSVIENTRTVYQYYYSGQYSTVDTPGYFGLPNGWQSINAGWANNTISPTEIIDMSSSYNNFSSSTYYARYERYVTINYLKNSANATGTMSSQLVHQSYVAMGNLETSECILSDCGYTYPEYNFVSWTYTYPTEGDEEPETQSWYAGEVFTYPDNYSYDDTTVINLNATWQKTPGNEIYKITLNNQGGNGRDEIYEFKGQKYATTNSTSAGAITSITIPTRTGYEFGGYYTGKNGSGTQIINKNGSIVVSNNYFSSTSTIYAKWTSKIITLTLDSQGASPSGTTAFYLVYGSKYTATDSDSAPLIEQIATKPTKYGYTFKGYYTSTKGSGNQVVDENGYITYAKLRNYTKFSVDTILYAYWEPNQYNVVCKNYIVDENAVNDLVSGKMSHSDFVNGNYSKKLISEATKKYAYGSDASGADFGTSNYGWYEYKGCTYIDSIGFGNVEVERFFYVYNNINIYNPNGKEDYKSATFNLSYDGGKTWQGVRPNENEYVFLPYGSRIVMKDFTPYYDYYVLDRYANCSRESDDCYYYDVVNTASTIEFYMKYKSVSISFNSNGGTLNGSSLKTVTYNSTYSGLPTATRSGYTFVGWFKLEDKDDPLAKYAEWNQDVNRVYGDNHVKLWQHYLTWGMSENRKISEIQNGQTCKLTENQTFYAGWVNDNLMPGVKGTSTTNPGKPGIYISGKSTDYNVNSYSSYTNFCGVYCSAVTVEVATVSVETLSTMTITKPNGGKFDVPVSSTRSTYTLGMNFPNGIYTVEVTNCFGGKNTATFELAYSTTIPIKTQAQLAKMGTGTYTELIDGLRCKFENTSAYTYELQNDIDISSSWNGVTKSKTAAFNANFDGNGYTISSQGYIDYRRTDTQRDWFVLFDEVGSGTISNFNLECCSVHFSDPDNNENVAMGLVAARLSGNGTFNNITVDMSSSSSYNALSGSDLSNAADLYMGAILGYSNDSVSGNINNCTSYISIGYDLYGNSGSGNQYIGGILGYGKYVNLTQCSNEGNIYASNHPTSGSKFSYIGGLAGLCGSINRCYYSNGLNSGEIYFNYNTGSGNYSVLNVRVGGLAGGASAIVNSYNAGIINVKKKGANTAYVGGLVGLCSASITNSYSLTEIYTDTGVSAGYLYGSISGSQTISNSFAYGTITGTTIINGTSKTRSEMLNESLWSSYSSSYWNKVVLGAGLGGLPILNNMTGYQDPYINSDGTLYKNE